ncbi:MAG: tryptophan synthase subunit alpha, partial [Victivallaceae bacterium]|nr:tryptophan synthase subunit alpha [Victivallaceae bacterium]
NVADGVIVGSAIVKKIGNRGDCDDMVKEIESFARSLVKPIKS